MTTLLGKLAAPPRYLWFFLRLQYLKAADRLTAEWADRQNRRRERGAVEQWRIEFDAEIRQMFEGRDSAEVTSILAQHPTERLHQLLSITQDASLLAYIRDELARRRSE